MTIKNILLLVSLGLLAWLFTDSFFQLDIAGTKNDILTNVNKMEVDRLQSIDSVKTIAKTNFDIIRNETRINSALASKRLWMITAIGLLQLCILFMNRKTNHR